MKFSTRTTYGLRAMTTLARTFESGGMSLSAIAKKENISLAYLERIFSKLKQAKLVQSEKGAKGGYSLVKDPKAITCLDIVSTLEGDVNPFRCIDNNGEINCQARGFCEVPKVLVKVQSAIVKTLKDIKLSDLI